MSDPCPEETQAEAAASAGNASGARSLLERAALKTPARFETWMKLAAMCRATGDLPAAIAAIDKALELDPLQFAALLAKASFLEAMNSPSAGPAYGHALVHKPAEDLSPGLAATIERAEQRYAEYQDGVVKRLRDAVDAGAESSNAEARRIDRFSTNVARTTKAFHSEPSHFAFPELPEIEFHDRDHFPWLAALESATDEIRNEFEALIAAEAAELVPYIQYPDHLPLRQWRELNQSRRWTAIHLLQNGARVEANARHCPVTMELLRAIPQPQVPDRSPNAMFSLLAPNTHIPAHTGVANTRLVCHLPLVVPTGCRFRVGAETRIWEEGQAFVFDDTIEHEAWNDSGALRVVLILDVWAWALSEREREAVAALMPLAGVDSGSAAL